MEIILLERVPKLGQMGEKVRVKNGYARNFLLPKGKALRATKANLEHFENDRSQLEARNLERRKEAEDVATKLDRQTFIIIRQAGETGHLYGSVSTRDIAETTTENGVSLERTQIRLDKPIKTIGLHILAIQLHPEVEITISINVARSKDEAERQAAGEDLTIRDRDTFVFEASEDAEKDGDMENDDDLFAAPPEDDISETEPTSDDNKINEGPQ